jgi:predicted SnoaL-like aldol condensation-catalyzing enzyme
MTSELGFGTAHATEGTMSETLQEKNKALLIDGFNTLFNDHNFAEAEKLWSPNYIQHSGHIPPGRDGLFNLVKAFPDGTKWDHGIIMAEGDYVMVHSRYSFLDGSALIVVDIMRIKDGVFQEHWDVSEGAPTEAESRSKRPVFGDKFPALSFKKSRLSSLW